MEDKFKLDLREKLPAQELDAKELERLMIFSMDNFTSILLGWHNG